ncbi:hypothetical protein N7532_004857 [Penicillium argentinense]|uniref:S-adenosyl-L-methionine-dependent methyltransferase n=1 Tax=Penicillium argentinense TaxID=1131581 RepID=A0A9W9FD01_9EURO|nr:uncharacterized protein N7532_004857 [Penicillium argentinense]KAJ5097856.1 hypothetical protein N7532_004857 [Penicillium argentinense]
MDDQPIVVDPDLYATEGPYYPEDWQSETTSIGSSIYRGLMENGRRYQSLRNEEYLVPSDDQMFETYEAGHLVALILDSERENPLFRSPVGRDPKHILDLGTGKGVWAIDVADMFPDATVRGVDLFPPPVSWMPPNCVLEVDDALQQWTWREPFDLIHMRIMIGSFNEPEWEQIYKRCYDNLIPGGWIEQVEASPVIQCDDGSLPASSILNTWGDYTMECAKRFGRELNAIDTMSDSIHKAGFVDVHEKEYKWPIGPWPRDKKYKEAGTVNFQHWLSGMEGWCMWLLTKYGSPEPWTKEEVHVYVAKMRKELKDPSYHTYQRARRVWARKPRPDELASAEKNIKVEKQ